MQAGGGEVALDGVAPDAADRAHPQFGTPFVDVDEWREGPRPHRYVHGGFEGTETLFSFFFPPAEQYGGRFIHYLEGGAGGSEHNLSADVKAGPGVRKRSRPCRDGSSLLPSTS